MPWKDNASVKKSIKGLDKRSKEEVTAFRKAANTHFASCMKDGGTESSCETSAIKVGWSAANKAKHERVLSLIRLEGYTGTVTKILVHFYDKDKDAIEYTGMDLWHYFDDENWKLYICDGSRVIGMWCSFAGVSLEYD